MAAFSITSLLSSVDQIGQNYVSTAYQALSNAAISGGATRVAGLLLTLYVTFGDAGITNWGPYIFAAVFYLVMAVLIGFALFLIVLSKLFMWLLLALAPVFIILLLFGVTSRFFSGWMTALVQYFFVQVLVYAFLAF